MGAICALIGLLLFVLVPLAQMLMGNGPNSLRKLLRWDLAAFFVITAGFAAALAVARLEQSQGWICVMVWILPIALALAWFLRYAIEDIAINFGKQRDRQNASANLAFLDAPLARLEGSRAVQPSNEAGYNGNRGEACDPSAVMKLPVRFPSDAEVISEEAARFRAMSGEERLQVIRGVLDAGALMLHNSPRSAFLAAYAAEQEKAAQLAITDFLGRHAD